MKKDPSIRCPKCGCFYLKSYLDMYGDGMCRSCGVETHKKNILKIKTITKTNEKENMHPINEILEKELNVDETKDCEKCGEEIGKRLIDNEIANYCKKCNWVTY